MCCRAVGMGQHGMPFLQHLKALRDYRWWYTVGFYHHHLGTWTECITLLHGRQAPLLSLTLVSLTVTSLQWRGRFPKFLCCFISPGWRWSVNVHMQGIVRPLCDKKKRGSSSDRQKKYIRGAGGWYLPSSGWWSSHTMWIIYSIYQKDFFSVGSLQWT